MGGWSRKTFKGLWDDVSIRPAGALNTCIERGRVTLPVSILSPVICVNNNSAFGSGHNFQTLLRPHNV